MPVTIHISGESAGQTLEELFGLSRGLCGGADVGTCSPAPTEAEAAPAQPAAAEPAPAKRTRRTKAEIEAEKVAEELGAADKIGRASGRARVFHYVYISVVSDSLYKKQIFLIIY